jgi:hypothetical protein
MAGSSGKLFMRAGSKGIEAKPNNEEEWKCDVKEVRMLRKQCSHGVGAMKLNNSRGKG